MTHVARILLAYALGGLAAFALYIASFALPIGGEILFYRGILLALLTALVVAAALFAMRRHLRVDLPTAMGVVLTGLAFNICFLVLFPVTIDRSITVFLLSRVATEQPLTAEALQQRFADEYLGDMRQISRRVREQDISGNITVDAEGSIRLTGRGEAFVALSKRASRWFRTDPRFVDPDAPSAERTDRRGLGKK